MAKKRRIKALHFKTKTAYRKWLAYGHMHVKGFGRKPTPKIYIGGKPYKPKRSSTRRRRKKR